MMLDDLFLELPIVVSFQVLDHELKVFVLELDNIGESSDDLVNFYQLQVDQQSKVFDVSVVHHEDQFQKEEVFEDFQSYQLIV